MFHKMPDSKVGKKKRPWSKTDIGNAVDAVFATPTKRLSIPSVSKVYNVPVGTLHRHVKKFRNVRKIGGKFQYVNNWSHQKVFTEDEEELLVSYIKIYAKLHCGLSKLHLRRLAYDYAKENDKKYPAKWNEHKLAEESWMRLFLEKYKDKLSLRKPEATSLSRCTSFNRHNVKLFFDNFVECHRKYGPFTADRMYNIDKTGLSTVTKSHCHCCKSLNEYWLNVVRNKSVRSLLLNMQGVY